MSRITDLVDGAGASPAVLAVRPSFAVTASAEQRARIAPALEPDVDLAAALTSAFASARAIEVVGFSAADAEPFAVEAGEVSHVASIVRERLAVSGVSARVLGAIEPIWAGHRGHAVWLHPAYVESARLAVALRVAEVADPARLLATHAARLGELANSQVASVDDLEPSLAEAALEAQAKRLLDVGADDDAVAPVVVRDPSSVVLVSSRGDAIVARATDDLGTNARAFGIVDRAGRPFVLPRTAPDLVGWLALLHRAIDRDAPASEVLGDYEGARVDGDAAPEIIAEPGAFVVVAGAPVD